MHTLHLALIVLARPWSLFAAATAARSHKTKNVKRCARVQNAGRRQTAASLLKCKCKCKGSQGAVVDENNYRPGSKEPSLDGWKNIGKNRKKELVVNDVWLQTLLTTTIFT